MDLQTALIIVGACVIAAIFGLSRLAEKKNRIIGQQSTGRQWGQGEDARTPPEFTDSSSLMEGESSEVIADGSSQEAGDSPELSISPEFATESSEESLSDLVAESDSAD